MRKVGLRQQQDGGARADAGAGMWIVARGKIVVLAQMRVLRVGVRRRAYVVLVRKRVL